MYISSTFRPCPGNNLIVFTITGYRRRREGGGVRESIAATCIENDAIVSDADGEWVLMEKKDRRDNEWLSLII